MLSVQNIKNKTFEKAIFGGYDAKGIDEFMEEIASEFSLLHKENVALKEKFKELTEKNEEYRSVENSMRKALISAQTIANDMVENAENERDRILKEAQEIAHEQINTYRTQISEEQTKLYNAKDKTSDFVTKMTAFYEKQIKEFVNLSKDLPIIKTETQSLDFTLELSKQNMEDFSAIKDSDKEQSITENILEKIKSETITPKVTVGSPIVNVPEENSENYNYIELDETSNEDKKLENSSKYNFSELKFGKGYKAD